jgi:HAD superfamily hydrolase (TIGR01509 family)
MLNALIFDVDGTLADTEEAHRRAFNAAFREAGLDWHWHPSLYARLLTIAGGKERLHHYWRMLDPDMADGPRVTDTIAAIHAIKTRHYALLAGGGQIALRPGVLRLLGEAQAAGVTLAIATTTTPANVDALLRAPLGREWPSMFAVVCDGDTAGAKKPAPDVYFTALSNLGLHAADCIAFEDSENGLRAACGAGIPTVVTPTAYTQGQQFGAALLQLQDLGDVDLAALRRLHVPSSRQAA